VTRTSADLKSGWLEWYFFVVVFFFLVSGVLVLFCFVLFFQMHKIPKKSHIMEVNVNIIHRGILCLKPP